MDKKKTKKQKRGDLRGLSKSQKHQSLEKEIYQVEQEYINKEISLDELNYRKDVLKKIYSRSDHDIGVSLWYEENSDRVSKYCAKILFDISEQALITKVFTKEENDTIKTKIQLLKAVADMMRTFQDD